MRSRILNFKEIDKDETAEVSSAARYVRTDIKAKPFVKWVGGSAIR
jgi:hypothetical protein